MIQQESLNSPKFSADSPINITKESDLQSICDPSQNGAKLNPYIIENLRINASLMHGIFIQGLDLYITIQNCTIYDGISSTYNGIFISSSSNITIRNNTLYNNFNGIRINDCQNINMSENTCEYNAKSGLLLENLSRNNIIEKNNCSYNLNGTMINNSYDNLIIDNSIIDNYYNGIDISTNSPNNNISKNYFRHNLCSIKIFESNFCTIESNTINCDNGLGLYLWSSNMTNVNGNYITALNDGIFLRNSEFCVISNNTCNGSSGIQFYYSARYNEVHNNTFNNNKYYGMIIASNGNNITKNNCIQNGHYGIYLYLLGEQDNLIMGNNCSYNNESGIRLYAPSNDYGFCNITKNFANHNLEYGIEISGKKDHYLFNNTCNLNKKSGILIFESSNAKIINNICKENNESGIILEGTILSEIKNNSLEYNKEGLSITFSRHLDISANNTVINNNIIHNYHSGIVLNQTYDNVISQNNCSENVIIGIRSVDSSNNEIYLNIFYDNANNVNSTGSLNNWSKNNYGNYWSDYNGDDFNNDDIGDTPYMILNDNNDNFPLLDISLILLDLNSPTWLEIPQNLVYFYQKEINFTVNATDDVSLDDFWLSDSINFTISNEGIITNNSLIEIGIYTLEISVNDTSGNILTKIINITIILEDFLAPVWGEFPSFLTIFYGNDFSYDINATDAGVGLDQYWLSDTENFQISSTGIISNFTRLSIGEYHIVVYVNDSYGNENSSIFTLYVNSTNGMWQSVPTGESYLECFDSSLNIWMSVIINSSSETEVKLTYSEINPTNMEFDENQQIFGYYSIEFKNVADILNIELNLYFSTEKDVDNEEDLQCMEYSDTWKLKSNNINIKNDKITMMISGEDLKDNNIFSLCIKDNSPLSNSIIGYQFYVIVFSFTMTLAITTRKNRNQIQ